MTTAKLLQTLRSSFAQIDAEAIILESLNISKTQLYTDFSRDVNENDLIRINTIVERRLKGEPLQYILGKAYFYDREFFVNPDVLIPRPDTETLVETVLNTEKDAPARFIDIGAGSGIISIILTARRPMWKALAVDISYDALRTAMRNINNICNISNLSDINNICDISNNTIAGNNKSSNILLICCDMLTAVKPKKQFDFIVSNPPYISTPQMETLDKSVVNYEPRTALHGGEDGLDYYRIISDRAKKYLKNGGRVYLEIGYDQGESVPEIFSNNGWSDIAVIKDLGGRNRVVTAV
jgi:release factor glutamine methyltransferase